MNILIVGTDFPPDSGGISTYTKELARSLSRIAGVTVLAPGARNAAEFDRACSYRVLRTPDIPVLRELAFFVRVPGLLRGNRFDAVLHTVWPTALASHFCHLFLPVPYFVSVHASEILDDNLTWRRRLKGLLRDWKMACLRSARRIFPVSRYTARIIESFNIDPARIRVISNGVDTRLFRPAGRGKTPGQIPALLTVARLDLHKGHDRVLEALAILRREGIRPSYIITGRGDQESRLRKMASDLGVADQVSFPGFIAEEHLPALYRNADIFVMASREIPGRLDLIEGFGISFLEAAASGLPVIGGNSGGVPDALRDGETGFLVDPDDPKAIATAIKKFLSAPELAERMGKAGRHWTETEMDWDRVAERMHEAIRTSLDSRNRETE